MRLLRSLFVLSTLVGSAGAADVPIVGLKLIVVDKVVAAGRAKAVFVSKDAGISKGTGTDAAQIEATLETAYLGVMSGVATGTYDMPQGSAWLVNNATVAKYVNKMAPSGGSVKVGVIEPGTLLKVVAKSLGDVPLDVSAAPTDPIYVALTVVSGAQTIRHCTFFQHSLACQHKSIAAGTGYKLVCKGFSMGDAGCQASAPCYVDLGATVLDTCNDLEWEKKDTAVGSGLDAGNLQDVDNRYSWAGRCTTSLELCQPNAAAAARCAAQALDATACAECGVGDGLCDVDPLGFGDAITTVWDWLEQVNAAAFAGHADWRLATVAGFVLSGLVGDPTGQAPELESILDVFAPGCGSGSPCIDPLFGPTVAGTYWSASDPLVVDFSDSHQASAVGSSFAGTALPVRAVRWGS